MMVVISDPKHLLKGIRYRRVEEKFSVGTPGNSFFFSLARIRDAKFLSRVEFISSHEGKIHDSLSLSSFSPKTLVYIRTNDVDGEIVMVAWSGLVAILTFPDCQVWQTFAEIVRIARHLKRLPGLAVIPKIEEQRRNSILKAGNRLKSFRLYRTERQIPTLEISFCFS
jgi:hypothetical protein